MSGSKGILRTYSRKDKYSIVAELLKGKKGRLLDVGARDRILSSYLGSKELVYYAADLASGFDYQLNLENPVPLDDRSFDHVVALDVLEHVEHIHQAFHELARLTRHSLIAALPNVATLPRRWSFLWRANLGTAKYDLLPEHQGDRHRWLTTYSQMNRFIECNASQAGLRLTCVFEELEGGPLLSRLGLGIAALNLLPGGLLTGRCIYMMEREQRDSEPG